MYMRVRGWSACLTRRYTTAVPHGCSAGRPTSLLSGAGEHPAQRHGGPAGHAALSLFPSGQEPWWVVRQPMTANYAQAHTSATWFTRVELSAADEVSAERALSRGPAAAARCASAWRLRSAATSACPASSAMSDGLCCFCMQPRLCETVKASVESNHTHRIL